MDKKILFIDGQVFQTSAWDRGMGKYSLALLHSMLNSEENKYIEVHIIFTKNLDLSEEVRKHVNKMLPKARIMTADLKINDYSPDAEVPKLQRANRDVLDKLLKRYIKSPNYEVDFLVLALFIGQACPTFPSYAKKILLFYDLIPLQYYERYTKIINYSDYLAGLKPVFEADVILTISQTVADDIALNLGIPTGKIFNIDGAAIKRTVQAVKKPLVKISGRYVLMPTGDETRKNNDRAVQGFEAYLQKSQDKDLKLVITSTFQDFTRHALGSFSPNLIFTGNVTEQELHWLYENAEALLFVSEYEGLGLPILESAEVNKPVVCSNIRVFNEMSPSAFYYSDPLDPTDIADALGQALRRENFNNKSLEYPAILKKYTWANTAQKAHKAIFSGTSKKPVAKKMRVAILAPDPSGYSAIGKLVMLMHPALQEYFEVDYYLERGETIQNFNRPEYLSYISNVMSAKEFSRNKYKQYDAVVYHIGNSEFHLETIKSSLYLPGYAIIHDTHLADIFKSFMLINNFVTKNRLAAERALDKKIGNSKASYLSSIANNQLALIAHSTHSEDSLIKSRLDARVPTFQLNIPTAVPKQITTKRHGERLKVGLAGIINPLKGLGVVEDIAKMDEFYHHEIHIFGIPLTTDEVLERLQSYNNVQVDTNLTDFQFQNLLSQLDILISFRPDNRGYPSMATIESMRFGVVSIVKRIGWYDELPDDAVVKVKNEKELVVELKNLLTDPSRRAKIAKAARRFIGENYSYSSYAKGLYDIISSHVATSKTDALSKAIKDGASLKTVKKLLARVDSQKL